MLELPFLRAKENMRISLGAMPLNTSGSCLSSHTYTPALSKERLVQEMATSLGPHRTPPCFHLSGTLPRLIFGTLASRFPDTFVLEPVS